MSRANPTGPPPRWSSTIGVAAPILLVALRFIQGLGLAIALLKAFDSWVAISVYVLAMLLFTIGAVVVARETANVDLAAERPEEHGVERQPLRRSSTDPALRAAGASERR